MMKKILINKLEFNYNGKEIFNNLNLEIDINWRVALVGKNGKGKTTLLKLIAEKLKATKGEIRKDIKTVYFPFEIEKNDETVLHIIKDMVAPFRKWEKEVELLLKEYSEEAIQKYGEIEEKYKLAGGYEIESNIKKELKELELEEEILTKNYNILSGGEKTKLMLLAVFLRKDSYILIDEPTNHLDMKSREKIGNYLKKKSGFMCVSHDRYFLDIIADHILSIEKNGLTISNTKYSNWEKEKEIKEQSELKKNERLKKDIKKLTQSMIEKEKWSNSIEKSKKGTQSKSPAVDRGYIGHKSAKMMQRAKNIEFRVEKQVGEKKELLKNFEKEYELKFKLDNKTGKNILTINNLNISYNNKNIIKDFNLNIQKGERVALFGKNGCGKSTIVKAVLNKIKYDSGIIHIPGNIKIQNVSQDFKIKFKRLKEYLIEQNIEISAFRNILACFGIKDDIFYKTSSEFSEGEKKKIQITKSIITESSLLIWDEPLNYLDICTRKRLEQAILKYEPTILFIEHDKYFVENIATKIIEL